MTNYRQIRAVKAIATGEAKTMKEALKTAGYSEAIQRNPHIVAKTKGFQELMSEYMPEEDIAKKHKELLDKQEVVVRNNMSTGEIEVIPTGQIDTQAVSKALDMYHKLRGSYAPTKSVNLNFSASKEHKDKAKKALQELLDD